MIEKTSELAIVNGIDFLSLKATDHRVYEKNKFEVIDELCSWLLIQEHKNHGVAVENLEREIMIRKIGDRSWPKGPIDLLGYMF